MAEDRNRIPLHNIFEDALHIGEVDTPEKMDKLLESLEAAAEAEDAAESRDQGKPKS
jgi:hypothetical protein